MVKIKGKYIVLIIIFQILGFAYFVKKDQAKYEHIKYVDTEMELKDVTIVRFSNRGWISINHNLYINGSSYVISVPDNFQHWHTHGPIIDADTIPHKYELSDLDVPYRLSKKANSDTLLVTIKNQKLKFLLAKE